MGGRECYSAAPSILSPSLVLKAQVFDLQCSGGSGGGLSVSPFPLISEPRWLKTSRATFLFLHLKCKSHYLLYTN